MFGNDSTSALMNPQKSSLPAQDLQPIKSVNIGGIEVLLMQKGESTFFKVMASWLIKHTLVNSSTGIWEE